MKAETLSELQKLSARCLLEISGEGMPGKAFLLGYTKQGEGNTTTLSALGEHLGRYSSVRTLLVDGNLRSPALHAFWRIPRSPGLAEACAGGSPLTACVHKTRFENLFVLPAGAPGETADEFFTRPGFRTVLEQIRNSFQLALFDAAPLLQFNDALALGKSLDGVVLLARAEFLPASTIQKTGRLFRDQDVRILGSVLARKRHYVPRFLRDRFHSPEEA